MTFETSIVPDNWKTVVIVSLYKGKREEDNAGTREALVCYLALENLCKETIGQSLQCD